MGYDGEGTIYIPLAEFWEFVAKYAPAGTGEVRYGVPRVVAHCEDLEIDYAFSTECEPDSWAKVPKAVQQWKALRGEKP